MFDAIVNRAIEDDDDSYPQVLFQILKEATKGRFKGPTPRVVSFAYSDYERPIPENADMFRTVLHLANGNPTSGFFEQAILSSRLLLWKRNPSSDEPANANSIAFGPNEVWISHDTWNTGNPEFRITYDSFFECLERAKREEEKCLATELEAILASRGMLTRSGRLASTT